MEAFAGGNRNCAMAWLLWLWLCFCLMISAAITRAQNTTNPAEDAIPTASNNPPADNNKNNTGLIVGILVPIVVVSFLMLLALYIRRQRRKRKDSFDNYNEELLGMDTKPPTFGYGELSAATHDFSLANKIGQGGFGPLYKGTLNDGTVVAVKIISAASRQSQREFLTEVATLSAVQHPNLVKLYGCCIHEERSLLVYEYLEHKSLDLALFGNNKLSLTWPTRFKICMGLARGLSYLHDLRIIHRDMKSSNVLLDCELNPKISDYGLARLYDDDMTHISTRIAGTIGYLAPEYAMRGRLTEKADVYGFGIVALEIISGRRTSDSTLVDEKIYLLEWAWKLRDKNREMELVDEELSEFDENEVKRLMKIALLCTQSSPTLRPSMSSLVAMISGDIEPIGDITRPEYLTDFKVDDATTFASEDPSLGSDTEANTSNSNILPHATLDISQPMLHDIIGEEFLEIEVRPYTFHYKELRDATNDFSPANKLGEGGFGPVYKGTLNDGRVIAVKQMSAVSHQGKSQYVAEITTISAIQHHNIVKLYGCCIDGEKHLLVYEYLENKSLDLALFGRKKLTLKWSTRFDICLGIARGLAYLHEESHLRIIHRDVKSGNVLLDSGLNPKISDFGLAKLYDDKKTHLSTRVAGTHGYLAPEYAMFGHLSEKVDVFGFGIVALEIISGRPNSDSSLEDDKVYILGWAWKLREADRELDMVDKELSEFDETEVKRVMRVALLCTQTSPKQRPSMSLVVAMLLGYGYISDDITRPGYLTCF